MKRRTFIKGILGTAGVAAGFRLPLVHAADHRGKFFVFVQADGGWDPTSFCDPKVNQKGEKIINRWADDGLTDYDLPLAGDIPYAPWAKNEAFFEEHFDKMLVINGVDAQTNSHTAGIVHNWSGRISEGYPTTTALLAANYGPDMSAAYLSFGGYSVTGGVTRYTRLNNLGLLLNIARPLTSPSGSSRYMTETDWMALRERQAEEATRLVGSPDLLPTERDNRELYRLAFANTEGLETFAAAIPPEDELKQPIPSGSLSSGSEFVSHIQRQAQLAVLAFKTGVAVSADLWQGHFDTHAHHDADHEWVLGQLTDGVNYLWRYAEEHGIDDRLVVVMGSDFGRTNHYNSQDGKDHWPYGSYIVMEQNQAWTDNVIGETNELHEAYNIDPETLERVGDNDPNGTHIYPKHVHKALRKYLGIENSDGVRRFPFDNVEDLAFFG